MAKRSLGYDVLLMALVRLGDPRGVVRATARRAGWGHRRVSHAPALVVGSAILVALASSSGGRPPAASASTAVHSATRSAQPAVEATASPAGRSQTGYHLDLVRLESLRLGLVGLSGDFTSRATERPARLLVTTNFGARFDDISPPAAHATRVDDVSFLDRKHGWVVIWNLDTVRVTVYRTNDGGRRWRAASAGSHSQNAGAVDTVQFLTRRLGWLVAQEPTAPGAGLFATRNGGASWHAVADLPEVAPVEFESPTEAWQAGGPDSRALFRSADGGRSWRPIKLPIPDSEREASALYGPPAFFGHETLAPVTLVRGHGADLAVYSSTDDGRHWRKATLLAIRGVEPAPCLPTTLSVSFTSRRDWWAAAYRSGRPVVYHTTTAGRAWHARQIAAPHPVAGCPLPQVHAASSRAAWALLRGAREQNLYATTDAGKRWRLVHTTRVR